MLEEVAEARVGLLGRREAGVLAHRPQAAAIHRRLDAAGERGLAGRPRSRSSSSPAMSAGCRGRGPRYRTSRRSARAVSGGSAGLAPGGLAPAVAAGVGPSPRPARSGDGDPPEDERRPRWSTRRWPDLTPRPSRSRRPQLVLHLHRLHHEELLARLTCRPRPPRPTRPARDDGTHSRSGHHPRPRHAGAGALAQAGPRLVLDVEEKRQPSTTTSTDRRPMPRPGARVDRAQRRRGPAGGTGAPIGPAQADRRLGDAESEPAPRAPAERTSGPRSSWPPVDPPGGARAIVRQDLMSGSATDSRPAPGRDPVDRRRRPPRPGDPDAAPAPSAPPPSTGTPRGRRVERTVERQRRLDAADLDLVEGPPQAGDRRVAVAGRGPSAWRSGSYSGGTRSPGSTPCRRGCPGRTGIVHGPIRPGVGANSTEGSSAAIGLDGVPRGTRPLAAAAAPPRTAAARRRPQLLRTRSRSETSSVTPCSTWSAR